MVRTQSVNPQSTRLHDLKCVFIYVGQFDRNGWRGDVCDTRYGSLLVGALTGRLSCGHSETGQANRRECTYAVERSPVDPETALHFVVIRSCLSRLAPFRRWFQNGRSVLSATVGSPL
jgi:hypothetical protein